MLRVSEWMKIYFQLQRAWATSQKQSQCLSEHLQERVRKLVQMSEWKFTCTQSECSRGCAKRGMFARELGAARQLTEEVPQHPANARKINTAREVRLRVRLSATWTKNRATDFTRVPGVWFFARQRTSKIYFQWENNRQITPRSQKQDCLVSYVVSAHTILPLSHFQLIYKKEDLPNAREVFKFMERLRDYSSLPQSSLAIRW